MLREARQLTELELHFVLIILGGLFLIGLATDELGRRTRLPRVTLLMLFGVLIGPAGLDILPHQAKDWYEFLASTALTMVAFLSSRADGQPMRRASWVHLSVGPPSGVNQTKLRYFVRVRSWHLADIDRASENVCSWG